MDHNVLVEAIAVAFMGYDHSSDADVDPDWACKIMESLADTLSQLSADDRNAFREDLDALAGDLPTDPFFDRWRIYYRDLPGILGWHEAD